MKHTYLIAATLAVFWGMSSIPARGADAKAGEASYKKACGACHAADGAPKEAVAKMLKVEMRHLGDPEIQAKKDAELSKEILEGTGKMKPVKGLNETQTADVIAFMRTLAKK